MSKILNQTFTLANGVKIPKIGLGTWLIDDDKVAATVHEAINLGYRHIDTAEAYGNERGVGEGVRTCAVAREEIFVTTKLRAEIKDYETAVAAIDESLQKLGLSYIDIMIIHSPQPWTDFREGEHFFEGNIAAWRALEAAYKAGKLRAIGVSNFECIDIENITANCEIKPMVNQVLSHIGNTPFELIDYCQKAGILIEAYSPVAHGAILQNAQVADIAKGYGVSVARLCVRYCIELGLLALPKTANAAHMRENADVDFEISPADMKILKQIAPVENYGEASVFPVFGGKLHKDGRLEAKNFKK